VNSCVDPEYEETFQFDVSVDDLSHRYCISQLHVHVYAYKNYKYINDKGQRCGKRAKSIIKTKQKLFIYHDVYNV
jgi:hypothetical protein